MSSAEWPCSPGGPGEAASSAVILSSAACRAGLGPMRRTISDPGASMLSTVYSCGPLVLTFEEELQ